MITSGKANMMNAKSLYTHCAAMCLAVLALALLAGESRAEEDFHAWLAEVRVEALERGISQQTIDLALSGLTPDSRVIGFDRNQPEFKQTFDEYLEARVTQERIEQGTQLLQENRPMLDKIGRHYGVEPEFLVAIWGLESSFGRYQGKYSIVRSLATLAHDPRRAAFFRNELFSALQILDEGHVPLEDFVGGWAGAMGQNQFIPSSFLRFAQDFDGDGKKNIWGSRADVWASIAFYLKQAGWQWGRGWGQQVAINGSLAVSWSSLMPTEVSPRCRALRYHTRRQTLAEWTRLGLAVDTDSLPPTLAVAALVPEDGQADKTWLVYGNYRAILDYNCANKYAVSVGILADRLALPVPDSTNDI